MSPLRWLLAGLLVASATDVQSGAGQARPSPYSKPHLPANLAAILSQGGNRLLELANERSRSLLRTALHGDGMDAVDKANATAGGKSGQLQQAMAAGTVAAGAVAGMRGWDNMQLGLWLAQTGMDGYQYQMNMWKLVGTGLPY